MINRILYANLSKCVICKNQRCPLGVCSTLEERINILYKIDNKTLQNILKIHSIKNT